MGPYKPAVIHPHFSLDFFLSHPQKELIREVEMGPFKHTVDDGLDLRKAAFECMYTLMETCLDQLDVFEFLSHIEDGLKDHYDIRVRMNMIVGALCTCACMIIHWVIPLLYLMDCWQPREVWFTDLS